jgi:hypothetical protein
MAQLPDTQFPHVQGLWKLPATTRQTNELSTALQRTIGLDDNSVIDLPPTVFWDILSQQCDFNNRCNPVVAILGDLIRGRIEGKSLPLYYQFQLFLC